MSAGVPRSMRPIGSRWQSSADDTHASGGRSEEASHGRRATALGEALLAALSQVAERPDDAQWVALDAEAKRRGLTTTAMRTWCTRHGVVIRQESHRRGWVSPRAIDDVIEGLPPAEVAPSRRGRSGDDDLDKVIDDQAARSRRGRTSRPSR
jgi:hypothetical protein